MQTFWILLVIKFKWLLIGIEGRSSLQLWLVLVSAFLLLGRIGWMLTRSQFGSLVFLWNVFVTCHCVEVEGSSKGFEFCFDFHFPTLPPRAQSSGIFLRKLIVFQPNCLIKFSIIVVDFVKKNSCIGKNLVAIINSQTRRHNRSNDFSIISWPTAIWSGIWFASSYFLFGLHVPHLHLPVEISKSSQTDKTT